MKILNELVAIVAPEATAEETSKLIERINAAIAADRGQGQLAASKRTGGKTTLSAPKKGAQEAKWTETQSDRFTSKVTPALRLDAMMAWTADGLKRGYCLWVPQPAPEISNWIKLLLERIRESAKAPETPAPETPTT